MVIPIVYTAPVTYVKLIKEKEAKIAYEKQEDGKKLNAVDRWATGERPVVTTARVVTRIGLSTRIPTNEDRKEMAAKERLKSGETGRHILIDKIQRRRSHRRREAYEKQENGEGVSMFNRIQMGERPTLAVRKKMQGHTDEHVPAKEERCNMTFVERFKSGEGIVHYVRQEHPAVRTVTGIHKKREVPKDTTSEEMNDPIVVPKKVHTHRV